MSKFFFTLEPKNENGKIGDILNKMVYEQDLNLRDFNITYTHTFTSYLYDYRKEIIEHIIDQGFTNFIQSGQVNEAVVPAGASQNEIIPIIQKYLDKLEVDSELIILDPYFYAPTNLADYPGMIDSILANYINKIDHIRIITTDRVSKIDSALKNQIELKLKVHKPTLVLSHITTPDYHDRYWISCNREKGVLFGTSINGLGNRLALIDRLNTTDVREIVGSLRADGLI